MLPEGGADAPCLIVRAKAVLTHAHSKPPPSLSPIPWCRLPGHGHLDLRHG